MVGLSFCVFGCLKCYPQKCLLCLKVRQQGSRMMQNSEAARKDERGHQDLILTLPSEDRSVTIPPSVNQHDLLQFKNTKSYICCLMR
jgi:hypothetical protein